MDTSKVVRRHHNSAKRKRARGMHKRLKPYIYRLIGKQPPRY